MVSIRTPSPTEDATTLASAARQVADALCHLEPLVEQRHGNTCVTVTIAARTPRDATTYVERTLALCGAAPLVSAVDPLDTRS
jgi:hypothetical protein